MKSTILTILVFIFVFSASCSKKVQEIDISGDIFIVTKGRENIKLGLVQVSVYPQNVILSHVQTKVAARDAALNEVKVGTEKCEKVLYSGEHGNGSEHRRVYEKCLDNLDSIKENVNSVYFEGLPAPISTVMSDGDGKFSLKVPKTGTYALVAKSDRSITNERIEYYQWIVSLKADEKAPRITLSNNNMLNVDSSPIALLQSL